HRHQPYRHRGGSEGDLGQRLHGEGVDQLHPERLTDHGDCQGGFENREIAAHAFTTTDTKGHVRELVARWMYRSEPVGIEFGRVIPQPGIAMDLEFRSFGGRVALRCRLLVW